MKILDIYNKDKNEFGDLFADQDREIIAVSIKNMETEDVQPIYDMIYCGPDSLNYLEPTSVPTYVKAMAAMLKDRGELWINTPSLEWCMQQILANDPCPAIHTQLYGPPGDHYACGYTVAWLRDLLVTAELIPRKAIQEVFALQSGETTYQVLRNLVIGWKVDRCY